MLLLYSHVMSILNGYKRTFNIFTIISVEMRMVINTKIQHFHDECTYLFQLKEWLIMQKSYAV